MDIFENESIVEQFVKDSKLLLSIDQKLSLKDITAILPFKLNTIAKIYSNCYLFTDNELLELSNQLNYLDSNYLDDILIFIYFRNIKSETLIPDLQHRYEVLEFQDNI